MNALTHVDANTRRVHQRGAVTLALGVVCGLAVFGWLAASSGPGARLAAEGEPSFALSGPIGPPRGAAAAQRDSLVLRSDNRGQVLFGRYCDSCHPAGNEGAGASLRSSQFKRTVTTPDAVAAIVRRGGFDMPAYAAANISDADLGDIAAYVLSLPEVKR